MLQVSKKKGKKKEIPMKRNILYKTFNNIHCMSYVVLEYEINKTIMFQFDFFFVFRHFPSEHFGKLVGIVIGCSGFTLILQFPLKLLFRQGYLDNTFYVSLTISSIKYFAFCYSFEKCQQFS